MAVTGGRVGEGVSVRDKVGVSVAGAVSLGEGVMPVALGSLVGEAVIVGIRIMGVCVTIPGVREGIGVQTGKGWGLTFHTSQPATSRGIRSSDKVIFILLSS
jgi:hypothetical protein